MKTKSTLSLGPQLRQINIDIIYKEIQNISSKIHQSHAIPVGPVCILGRKQAPRGGELTTQ